MRLIILRKSIKNDIADLAHRTNSGYRNPLVRTGMGSGARERVPILKRCGFGFKRHA